MADSTEEPGLVPRTPQTILLDRNKSQTNPLQDVAAFASRVFNGQSREEAIQKPVNAFSLLLYATKGSDLPVPKPEDKTVGAFGLLSEAQPEAIELPPVNVTAERPGIKDFLVDPETGAKPFADAINNVNRISGFIPETTSQEENNVTPKGLQQLEIDEGSRLKAYKDSKGIDTIGVGFNLQEPANARAFQEITGFSVDEARKGKTITPAQQHALLVYTVNRAELDVKKLVPQFDSLEPDQQDALTNFVFNVGLTTASQFKNTLAAVNRGDGAAAAAGLRASAYYKQVGQRGERVAKALSTLKPIK